MQSRLRWSGRWILGGLGVMLAAAAAGAGEIPGRITFVGHDHQIYVADPNGGDAKALTRGDAGRMTSAAPLIVATAAGEGDKPPVEVRYAWPSWGPDGKTILAQGTRIALAGIIEMSGVYRLDADRPGVVSPLYESREHAPIYTFFAPSGREAAVLVAQDSLLGLGLLGLDDGTFRALGLGLPYYLSWRSDGDAIVTHTGGAASEEGRPAEIALIDVASARTGGKPRVERLSDKPALFRAPSYAPDGSVVAYAVRGKEGRGASLMVRSRDGKERSLGQFSSRMVFSWVPDGSALTVAEATTPDNLMFGGVTLVSLADGKRETIYAGAVGAFFWSPDASELLVLAPEFDSGEWRWLVVDRGAAGKEAREVGRFFPTPEFQSVTPHFDQFALSHRLWAPDSRHFVYFGYPSTARDENKAVPATVWIGDAKTAKVKILAEGRAAFWSPK